MEQRISRGRFIRLGTALGVGAASASMLAACGSGGESAGESGDGSGDASGGGGYGGNAGGGSSEAAGGGSKKPRAQGGNAIAETSEVAPGSAVEFEESGSPAVLVHLDSGPFVAYSAVCTHQGCTVAYQNGQLACPCHGSVFDPANGGAVVNGPAQTPLPEIPVKVSGGEVFTA